MNANRNERNTLAGFLATAGISILGALLYRWGFEPSGIILLACAGARTAEVLP